MIPIVYTAALFAAAAPGRHDMEDLARRIASATGAVAALDPRLDMPHCPTPEIDAVPGSARVRCPAPAWTLYIPLQLRAAVSAPGPQVPVIRRGDPVVMESEGAGYRVTIKAVADADARDGRVWIKGQDGRRRLASLGAEGRLTLRH